VKASTTASSSSEAPFRNSRRIFGARRTSFKPAEFSSISSRSNARGSASGFQSPQPVHTVVLAGVGDLINTGEKQDGEGIDENNGDDEKETA
jgi:hypothetical protein